MNHQDAPVVIGATGGSGTRVFAKICMRAGYFMGTHLNNSLDALHFADFYNQWINLSLRNDRSLFTHDQFLQRDKHFKKCVQQHRTTIGDPNARWGWKGPRSMFFLDVFIRHYPAMKFVHVIRDGRDMAYSSNQSQLHRHGSAFLDKKWEQLNLPHRSILLWNICNMSVATYAQEALGNRYLSVRFEDLCAEPEKTIAGLLYFLECRDQDVAELQEEVHIPDSIGRWRSQPTIEVHELVSLGQDCLELFGYI